MRPLFSLGLALALALPLLSVTRSVDAAETPKVIAQVAGDPDPFVWTWVNAKDGSIGLDSDYAASLHDLFASSTWVFGDIAGSLGVLQIGQVKADKFEPFLTLNQVHDTNLTLFFFHHRAKDGSVLANGYVSRASKDAANGIARFTCVIAGEEGETFTSYVEMLMTFAK